jgi:hypothetical protein
LRSASCAITGEAVPANSAPARTRTRPEPSPPIVHAERLAPVGQTREEAIYQVRMVPRAALLAAAASQDIRPDQIVGIADEAAPDRTDFWRAAFPLRAALRWTPCAPVLVVAACVGLLLAEAHYERDSQLARLEGVLSARLIQLRQVTDELDARRKEQTGSAELVATLSASVSAFNILVQLKATLPPDVQIQRVEFDGATLRVSVRVSDALALVRHFGGTMSAQIDGAITVDPSSGREQATIRLLQSPGDGQ